MATVKTADAADGTTKFEHSFTSPTADLIIRSSDGMDFRVHKVFLSDASPVFADMFSLPQPDDSKDILDGLPVVPLSEDSKIVNTLLEFCYPSKVPKPTDLDELRDVLIAADKYSMSEAIAVQCEGFLWRPEFLEKQPWRVYGLACRWCLTDLAKAAAKETLKQPIPQDATQGMELQDASGLAVFKLFCYRQKCAALFQPLLVDGSSFLAAFNGGRNYVRPAMRIIPHRYECPLHIFTGTGFSGACQTCSENHWTKDYLHVLEYAFIRTPYGQVLSSAGVIRLSLSAIINSGCVTCQRQFVLGDALVDCNMRIGHWLDAEIAKIPLEL